MRMNESPEPAYMLAYISDGETLVAGLRRCSQPRGPKKGYSMSSGEMACECKGGAKGCVSDAVVVVDLSTFVG
jgi:hypothetical protein